MSLEYKSEVLTPELICSVTNCVFCCMFVTPLTFGSLYHIIIFRVIQGVGCGIPHTEVETVINDLCWDFTTFQFLK
jgi:MFS family permease